MLLLSAEGSAPPCPTPLSSAMAIRFRSSIGPLYGFTADTALCSVRECCVYSISYC